MPLRNFLNYVLPNEGVKCWVEITKEKKVIQGFVTTTEQLALTLQEIDARGSDAYFACASFVTPRSRRAGNVLGAQALWVDVDCGEGKPYATADDGIRACDEFCDRTAIDFPGIVRSGGGIHCYWTLDRTLTREEWLHLAGRFKLLTVAQGFHCDPSRTADIASILRAPGTKNYKLPPPRAVALEDIAYFEPLSYEELSVQIIKNLEGVRRAEIKISSTPQPITANQDLMAGLHVSKAFDATVGVAQGCRGSTQLRYAGELVAKGYSFDDVYDRCIAWNALCTPPQEETEVRRIVKSAFSMHAARHPAPPPPPETPGLPVPPAGFKWGNANELLVKIVEKDAEGKPVEKWKTVCKHPVFLASFLAEEGHKTKHSYLFWHYHPVKGWQQFSMSGKEFNSGEWYGAWMENGTSIMEGMDKQFKAYIRKVENMLREPGKEMQQYNQFGWKDDDKAFLIGPNLCKFDGSVVRAHGTQKLAPLMNTMQPSKHGSLHEWSHAANQLGMPSMEAHLFMLLAGFAAPLMKFCVDEGNGGAILSIISEGSGHGKTPMATAIASIWGELAGTVVTGTFTEYRRIEELVRHCHLPQVQEEMAYIDPSIAALSVERFTSGTDRGRLTQGGAATGIPERYQTVVVSLSNKSLYELVRMVNIPMSRRIFEIEIARPDSASLDNIGGIAREMLRNHGHAGLQFARIIVNPQVHQYIKERLAGINIGSIGHTQRKYRDLLQSGPEDRFIVWLLSAVEVAARILVNYGILQFDVDRIMQWAVIAARERIQGPRADDATLKLHDFLSEHLDQCITVAGPYMAKQGQMSPIRTPMRNLTMRMEIYGAKLFIDHSAVKKWCTRNNISFIAMGRKLKDLGVLVESSRLVTLGAGTPIPSGRPLCWEIDMNHPMMSGQLRMEIQADNSAVAQV